MTASFVRNSLDMRCVIVRDTSIRPNPFGGPAGGFMHQTIATDQPCRIWMTTAKLVENGQWLGQFTNWKGRFPIDTDLNLKDRVLFSINGKPFSVEILTVRGRPARPGYRFAVRRHVIATGRTVG